MEFTPVIGLEIHVELLTGTKLFCSCSSRFGAPPNTQVCPICLGLPGSMPVLNSQAVSKAVTAALALGCKVHSRSIFARKHYFYPDLPKGYQITQLDFPLAEGGLVNLGSSTVTISRLHLEEDAGKLSHTSHATFVDYNRSGIALAEIVTSPCLDSPAQAKAFLEVLKQILQYAKVSDCRMEEGSLRCDVNVSLKSAHSSGTRVEVKNLNSFRAVQQALDYEIRRQRQLLELGREVAKETRRWDEDKCRTASMRNKEDAADYRFLPEPDLPPVMLGEDFLEEVIQTLPELPLTRKARFLKVYGISAEIADALTRTRAMADWYEQSVAAGAEPRIAANWLIGEMIRLLNFNGKELPDLPFTPQEFASLLDLLARGTINGPAAKAVLAEMFTGQGSPEAIIKRLNLAQLSDRERLAKLARQAVAENPDSASGYLAGRKKALGYLMGRAMELSLGRANPELLRTAIIRELEK